MFSILVLNSQNKPFQTEPQTVIIVEKVSLNVMLLSLKKRLPIIRKEKGECGSSEEIYSPLDPSPAFLFLPYFKPHEMGSDKAGKPEP